MEINNWIVQNNEGVDTRLVNTETGEFFDNYNDFKNSQDKNIKDIKNETQFVKQTFGIKDKKDTHQFNWNNNKGNPTYFTKNYKTYQKECIKNMNMNEIGLMTILSNYLESETNRVLVNKSNPSNKTLADISNLGISTLKKTLANLKDNNLIYTIGNGLGREIYINPNWAFDGKDIEKKTLDFFNIKY